MAEAMYERAPQVGDHVEVVGTSITGDVQRGGSSSDHSPMTFKADPLQDSSRPSKAVRALRGAWITCPPELLTLISHPGAWPLKQVVRCTAGDGHALPASDTI